MKSKLLLATGIIVAILVTAGVYLRHDLQAFFGAGSGRLEQWVGAQVQRIANDHLGPELSFEDLDYEYPLDLSLRNARLVEGDLTILEAASLRIELAERPRVGEPIVIGRIIIDRPVLRAVRDETGGLRGFSNLVTSKGGTRTDDGGSTVLSDVFSIREISILNGAVEYTDPAFEQTMALDDITFDLQSNPDAEGWHTLDTVFERRDLFRIALNGRVDLDRRIVELNETTLRTSLDAESMSHLPPSLQALVQQYEVTGRVNATLSGRVALDDPASNQLEAELGIQGAHVAMGEYQLPVQSIDARANLSGNVVTLDYLIAGLLGGTVQADGTMTLGEVLKTVLKYDVQGVRLEEALRNPGETPKYAGRVDLSGTAELDAKALAESLTGSGSTTIEEGRLVNLPIISALASALDVSKESAGKDRANFNFTLEGSRILLHDLQMTSGLVAARGEGEVYFDSRLNLRLNAGPLERLQGALGAIGDLFGKLTDQLMKYQVVGTWSEPKVEVKPLGIGAGQ